MPVDARAIWKTMAAFWDEGMWKGQPLPPNQGSWTDPIAETLASCVGAAGVNGQIEVWGKQWRLQGRGGYLLDQVWSVSGGSWTSDYRGLVLGFECELNKPADSPDGWSDFLKLLDTRTDLRVFLGKCSPRSAATGHARFIDRVKEALRSHRWSVASDAYLIMLYWDTDQPDDDLHGWLVHGDGRSEDDLGSSKGRGAGHP